MERNTGVTNKVIILYILSSMEDPTLPRLTDLAVGTAYMDYFQFMQAFDELRSDECVALSVRKDETMRDAHGRPVERCALTRRGSEALRTLVQGIPRHVADYLAAETGRWSRESRSRRAAEAYSLQDPAGGYLAALRLSDGIGDLLHLRLRLPTQSEAAALCERFRADPAGFHRNLMRFAATAGQTEPLPDESAGRE
ncbi:MAG: DUF4364 family protein [Clostridia bacterium]|nr:DUF4364 family protein [Clostridia bacterium]